MSWVNNLLSTLLKKPSEKVSFTFRGNAWDNIEWKPTWDKGFEAGYEWTMNNWKLTQRSEFPEGWNDGWFGNGFAEGHISARGDILRRDYPGMLSLSWVSGCKYEITFKDGRKIIVGE